MSSARTWSAIVVLACMLALTLVPVQAQQPSLAHGTVVQLQGTPHLWFADEYGVLHWGGDARALAGRHINWSNRVEASFDSLRTLPRSDPWLSAGLLKDGDPIYLVKWETEWEHPKLLHIQSIADVELFGINASNYGRFVLDKATWEARYGMSVDGLQRASLPPAVPVSVPLPAPMPLSGPQPVTFAPERWTSKRGTEAWEIQVVGVDTDSWLENWHHHQFNSLPPAGYRQLTIAVKLENLGTRVETLLLDDLQDSRGRTYTDYQYSCGAIPNQLRSTWVSPGEARTGNICFQVPSDRTGFTLIPGLIFRGNPLQVTGAVPLPPPSPLQLALLATPTPPIFRDNPPIQPNPTPTISHIPGEQSHNPAPIGTGVEIEGGWRITVLAIYPDYEARIRQFGGTVYNPARPGYKLFVAKLRAEWLRDTRPPSPDGLRRPSSPPLELETTGQSKVYESNWCAAHRNMDTPEQDFPEHGILPGEQVEGSVCFEVRQDDVDSLVMIHDPYGLNTLGTIHPADIPYLPPEWRRRWWKLH